MIKFKINKCKIGDIIFWDSNIAFEKLLVLDNNPSHFVAFKFVHCVCSKKRKPTIAKYNNITIGSLCTLGKIANR